MTEDTAPAPTITDDLPDFASHPEADEMLQLLVALTSRGGGTSIGITLNTRGGVVTGKLVARKDWFQQWLATAEGNELAEIVINALDNGTPTPSTPDDDGPVDPDAFGFIHLVEARHVQGGQLMPNAGPGGFWRGRLSDVSGWTMVELNPS